MRTYPLLSVGPDWITVTATDPPVKVGLAKVAHRLRDAERDAESTPRAWQWRGYAGWQCGSISYGERPDSTFCQVSGSLASLYWLALLDVPVNVTRFDLQATVGGVPPKINLAWREWERINDDITLRRKNRWRSCILTKPTGATLYLGSPRSERRLRLYDKHAESPLDYPAGTWRYEVQARHGLAGSLATGLAAS